MARIACEHHHGTGSPPTLEAVDPQGLCVSLRADFDAPASGIIVIPAAAQNGRHRGSPCGIAAGASLFSRHLARRATSICRQGKRAAWKVGTASTRMPKQECSKTREGRVFFACRPPVSKARMQFSGLGVRIKMNPSNSMPRAPSGEQGDASDRDLRSGGRRRGAGNLRFATNLNMGGLDARTGRRADAFGGCGQPDSRPVFKTQQSHGRLRSPHSYGTAIKSDGSEKIL